MISCINISSSWEMNSIFKFFLKLSIHMQKNENRPSNELNCFPSSKFLCWSPNVTVFGDKNFKEIMLNEHRAPTQQTWCPYKMIKRCQECTHTKKRLCKDTEKRSHIQVKERSQQKPTNTLTMDFQPPKVWENKFLLF